MGGLQRFEHKLEQVISGAFAKAFRSAVQPVEIAAALQRECDNNAQILSRERRMVPNDFHVELAQTDLDRLSPYDTTHGARLHRAARGPRPAAGLPVPRPDPHRVRGGRRPHHRPVPDPQQRPGRRCQSNASHTQAQRARAFVVAGDQQHPLHPPATVVGRGTEADIRVNDPGVSRRHIEFQLVGGGRRAAGAGARPRLDQRHAGRRPPRHQHQPARRVRGQDRQHHAHRPDRHGSRPGSPRCLS